MRLLDELCCCLMFIQVLMKKMLSLVQMPGVEIYIQVRVGATLKSQLKLF